MLIELTIELDTDNLNVAERFSAQKLYEVVADEEYVTAIAVSHPKEGRISV